MPITTQRLTSVVEQLCSRPGHNNVLSLVRELCEVGIDIPANEIDFEVIVPEVRGRLDAVFGSTVFEFKRDLRHETYKAEEQLTRYLSERAESDGPRYLGIATDGAAFVAYELLKGRLTRLEEYTTDLADPRELLQWLDKVTTVREDISPDPDRIRAEFGRDSLVFRRSMQSLAELWEEARTNPEAELKNELWREHLEFVYGTLIEPEELFLQHTYLTIIAKTMAKRALVSGPASPEELLDGTPFTETGLHGAIEADFFNWMRLVDGGTDLVERIARQVGRFRLSEIEVDVLKAIYESLIDPQQRHYLGEYYTPDWLADWMCREVVTKPLNTRVFDPACGSGTFLFHSVRRYLAAADKAGTPLQEALEGCTEHVFGLDVHPVAVLFARVTYLLAIGPDRLRGRTGELFVPVYLGDALQWNVRPFLTEEEVEISVPGERPLRFPGSVAGDPKLLDTVLQAMRNNADNNAPTRAFKTWIANNTNLPRVDRDILTESYTHMRSLHQEGRNHIWTYIVRNLTRPLWLSHREGKPDVVIGNPPWLRYNAMSRDLKQRFRDASRERGLWVGGNVATHQDLSAYFFARSVERYLDHGGRIAFVMPFACLSRRQYDGFRKGRFADRGGNLRAIARFDKVWTFNSDVEPLFPVPAAVVFGHRDATVGRLPETVTAFRGQLPKRDSTPRQARGALTRTEEAWPTVPATTGGSPYREQFKNGATIFPRRLTLVVPVEAGDLGSDQNAPLVTSRIGAHDKAPWRDLEPLRGQIERRFLRPLLLGKSIAPFRVFRQFTAVIPWDGRQRKLLDARAALERGHLHLAKWLETSERLWNEHSAGEMKLNKQLDYFGKLKSQFPISPLRVVYAASGVKPCAAILHDDTRSIVEHALYWTQTKSIHEARYLTAILNSEAARQKIESMQNEGQFGARHFDKVMFNLPIPRFSRRSTLHREIADAGMEAEEIAADVALRPGQGFQAVRRLIREELQRSGISARIDVLVIRLLEG